MSVEQIISRLTRVLLDLGCTLVGLGVIVHQALVVQPGQASPELLVAAVSILAYPSGAAALTIARGGSSTRTTGSSSVAPGSLPEPSSSPSGSSAGSEA